MLMQDFTKFAPAAPILAATPFNTGIATGTLVDTQTGWRAVETLRRGDSMQSYDGGLRRIRALDRAWLLPGAEGGLICLPGGTLDNCADLWVLPGQHLLIDLRPADATPDALVALIPAEGVLDHGGTYRATPAKPVEVITPLFDEEEAIWVASGILLHCPAVAEGAGRMPQSDFFTRLTVAQTRALLARRAGLAREVA